MQSRAAWMKDGKFGLMVHWLAPGPPARIGTTKSELNAAVDGFDVNRFIADFSATGADWLIFTIGQNSGYYASPNKVLDRLVGSGHCSERDLVYEIAQAVKDQGKRFIAYLPCEVAGQSNDMIRAFRWNTKEGTNQVDFQLLYTEFIAEYANRYGSHLDGWWFDGAYTWSIFHNSYLNAFLYLSAARAGNPQTAVAFNDGSFCVGSSAPVVKDQDYLAGETEVLINGQVRYGREMDAPLLTPMDHSPQPPQNCLWHALVPIDCMWAHGYSFYDWQNAPYEIPQVREGEMEPPIYPTGILNKLVKDFKQVGGGVTFNVGIFQEGELGEATVAQLAELSRMIS